MITSKTLKTLVCALLFFGLLIFFNSNSRAQSFTGLGGIVLDDGNPHDFPILVSGLPNTIGTSVFGLENICLNIEHDFVGSLRIWLVSPDNNEVELYIGNLAGGVNFTNCCFASFFPSTPAPILLGSPPYSGLFRPMEDLGHLNNGQDPNGTWKLRVQDVFAYVDTATVIDWTLNFSTSPSSFFQLQTSNLPIVKINTNGQAINGYTKINAWMGVIDNGPGTTNNFNDPCNNFCGTVGIEIRGNSSTAFPQLQYNVETRDTFGNNFNVPLLGMPAENDWVLYAPYNDKSLMRNSLSFELANQMGRYASRARYCEVTINNKYKGVYTFFEKIKKDSARVNIATLNPQDISGAELTGGYICSIDWAGNAGWNSNFPPDPTNPQSSVISFQYIYPEDNQIQFQQQNYIQQFVDSFEVALDGPQFMDLTNGWRAYGAEGSFIDYFLINELSKNVDAYRLSTYFHKEKITDGDRIKMGPIWDYNLAWNNANYCGNYFYYGWAYDGPNYCPMDMPFWWKKLIQDTVFVNNVKCRWLDLRTNVLTQANIFSYIDSIASLVDLPKDRHFNQFPVLGFYVWPNPSPLATSHQQEINQMKSWITQRLAFMDSNLPGVCNSSSVFNADEPVLFSFFPNPANSYININYATSRPFKIIIQGLDGKVIQTTWSDSGFDHTIDISQLAIGVYLIQVVSQDGQTAQAIFAKN